MMLCTGNFIDEEVGRDRTAVASTGELVGHLSFSQRKLADIVIYYTNWLV